MGIESLDCLKWHLLLREEDQVNVVGEVLQVLTIFSFLLLLHSYNIKVILASLQKHPFGTFMFLYFPITKLIIFF